MEVRVMKKETRIAIVAGKSLGNYRVYVLTVLRGKIVEGVEFYKANSSFELSSAIISSKYYNEIRIFIVITGKDPFVNDDFYVRIAKPIILTKKLESVNEAYGLSIDEARSILNFLVKSTFLEVVEFIDKLFHEAIELLEEPMYGKEG